MTYHIYGTMELCNYGTKMTQIKHGKKNKQRHECTLRFPGTRVPTYPGSFRQARQVLLALNEVLHLIRVHFRETRKVVRRGGLDILFPVRNDDFFGRS